MTRAAELARRPMPWIREHPFAADAILGALLTALALVLHATTSEIDGEPVHDPTWWTVALVVLATLPVMFRRRNPVIALAVVLAGQLLCEGWHVFGSTWLAVLVAVYSVGAHTEGRRRARQQVEALADRADRAERERDLLARERVAEERNRIARELHDIVAHSVSVMVIQASAARRNLATRPDEASALLENVERTGRQTMDELRQVLGVLRQDGDGDSPAVPLPTLGDLPALVENVGGLPVRLAVIGATDRVPARVAVSVYRIVQEALTNANRHAGPGATVDVLVTCTASDVDVVVADDGRGASAVRDDVVGYGLVGMRERVMAAGGSFRAGPHRGGGWRVSATIPVLPATAEPVPAGGSRLVS
jgi:signal transduction histidine kinase